MSRPLLAGAISGRRRFLQIVGLTAMASSVNSTMVAWAQTRAPATATTPARADTGANSSTPPPISEEARTLSAIVNLRYGKHLSPAQLEAVTREIDGRVQGGQRLRQVRLANADEPDFVFHAG